MKWGDILVIRHNVLGRISWWQGGDPHKRTREARYYPHLAVVKTFKEGVNRVMGLFKAGVLDKGHPVTVGGILPLFMGLARGKQ